MSNAKAINAYRMYLAVKMHFMSDNYDITEHKEHIRVSYEKFAERNQQSLYEKFADKFSTKQEMAQYLIANFAYGAWGKTDIVYGTSEADQNINEWHRRKQSITQVLKNDLSKIRLHLESNNMKIVGDLDSKYPCIPQLFQMYLGNHITIETLVMMDKYHPFLDNWKHNLGTLFTDEIRRVVKVRPFVKFDDSKIKPIVTEFIKEN
jgi:hypothetical protein